MDKYMYEETRLRMAHRAKSFGIAAMACAAILFSVPFVAIGLGFLAILFGYLSRGYKPHLDKDAKIGVAMATLGIIIGVTVIGSAFHKLFTDLEYRQTITTIMDEMYGDMYEEEYGENFSDLFEEYFGGQGGASNGNIDL